MCKMIKTERLHITPLNLSETKCRVYSWTGMVSNQEEEDNFVKYTIQKMEIAPQTHHKWYTIWDAKDSWGNRILECGFICPPVQKIVEVWYYTSKEYMNKGFATEAIKGLIKFATCFDIQNVCASIAKDNVASRRVAEKCGLTYLMNNKEMQVYNLQLK